MSSGELKHPLTTAPTKTCCKYRHNTIYIYKLGGCHGSSSRSATGYKVDLVDEVGELRSRAIKEVSGLIFTSNKY